MKTNRRYRRKRIKRARWTPCQIKALEIQMTLGTSHETICDHVIANKETYGVRSKRAVYAKIWRIQTKYTRAVK